jgi:purine nucleosidase
MPIIVDTDGGVDDAAALWWALTDPSLDVIAVTVVWGNVPLTTAAISVARVLAATGRSDVALALGAAGPIGPAPDLRRPAFIHGADGLGDTTKDTPPPANAPVGEPATALLRRLCSKRQGQVTVVTLGPLSNLGALLEEDPGFAGTVRDLVVMGGSARAGGNALPNGEANIAHDPVAAATVAAADWARPPLLVGLDVTLKATLTERHFELLAEHRCPAAAFLDAPLRYYRRFGGLATAPDAPCHDLLAVVAVADPQVITRAPLLPMAVDTTGGPSWGATVVDSRPSAASIAEGSEHSWPPGFYPWRISLEADVDRFRAHATELFGGSP